VKTKKIIKRAHGFAKPFRVTRIVVAAAVIEALDGLDLRYPKVSKEKLKELAAAKRALD
jgi:hypothetical protein